MATIDEIEMQEMNEDNVKLNTAAYTVLSFIDIELRRTLKRELTAFSITPEQFDKITDNILVNLNNDPMILMEFINDKKDNIKTTKQNIKSIIKNTKLSSKLVKIAKTPKIAPTPTITKPHTKADYSNAEYLNKLNLTDLKPILNELSRNRTDINKYGKKAEIIETIIRLNNAELIETIKSNDETNDNDINETIDETNDDDNINETNDDTDDEKPIKITGKKIAKDQTPKKVKTIRTAH